MSSVYKNTGRDFENEVYEIITKYVNKGDFVVGDPLVVIEKSKKYYSRDREGYIKVDISIEKYLEDPKKILM